MPPRCPRLRYLNSIRSTSHKPKRKNEYSLTSTPSRGRSKFNLSNLMGVRKQKNSKPNQFMGPPSSPPSPLATVAEKQYTDSSAKKQRTTTSHADADRANSLYRRTNQGNWECDGRGRHPSSCQRNTLPNHYRQCFELSRLRRLQASPV
ncbi:hypothetical protein NPIL_625041 [Nephila pilipes]|uniref:Uncharacterized protein n=1 Tax=Nephila pilipes TaxID=299642 RepID=A0A8X6K4N3_NEPPI|nr:hypothetical protein NPIL_625041 [Nephila pilipes]